MDPSLEKLFRASSLRELFEDAPEEDPNPSLHDIAASEAALRANRSTIEEYVQAALPGDCKPSEAWFEQLSPTQGRIAEIMAQAREGHRVAEEHPERGAYHGGPPSPDLGGRTFPYNGDLGALAYLDSEEVRVQPAVTRPGSPTVPGAEQTRGPVLGFARRFPVYRGD